LQLASKIFKNLINLYIIIFIKNEVCTKPILQADKKRQILSVRKMGLVQTLFLSRTCLKE